MTEQQLRALVRQAIAHHLDRRAAPGAPVAAPASQASALAPHASHAVFMLPVDPSGACVVEPAVSCNHCGFCKSYGH